MKKILDALNKEKVQKLLFIFMIVFVFGVFMLSVLTNDNQEKPDDNPIDNNQNNSDNQNNNNDNNNEIEEPKEKFKAPCDDLSCQVIRYFYSLDDDSITQEKSIIKLGNKYQMSKGISYKKENNTTFDVCATLSGKVENIVESDIYGCIVTIDHGDNVKSEYASLSSVLVEINDEVKQGDVIGSSSNAVYDEDAGNHVHFRVSVDGKYVNPLTLLDKEK